MRTRLLACSLFVACGGSPAAMPDGAVSPDSTALPDAPTIVDPWTQALGSAVPNATLADGWTDLSFLPPPMAITGGWTDSLFALPDGVHMRFAYAPMDFFDFFLNGTVTVTGPQLLGTTGSTFKMFDATLTGSGWTISTDPVASTDPAVVEASSATNASDDLYIFTRFDATGHSQLFYSALTSGTWSTPASLPFAAAACNDDNAKIEGELATGVTIYFESNRGDAAGSGSACGERTLYTTTYAGSAFTPVTQIPGIATGSSDDSQPFVTADGKTLYFSSVRDGDYGVFAATLDASGSASDVHEVVTATTAQPFAGHLVLTGETSIVEAAEGDLLYLMCGVALNEHGGDTYGDADDIQLHPCVARRPK